MGFLRLRAGPHPEEAAVRRRHSLSSVESRYRHRPSGRRRSSAPQPPPAGEPVHDLGGRREFWDRRDPDLGKRGARSQRNRTEPSRQRRARGAELHRRSDRRNAASDRDPAVSPPPSRGPRCLDAGRERPRTTTRRVQDIAELDRVPHRHAGQRDLRSPTPRRHAAFPR